MCDPYEDPVERPEIQPLVGFRTPIINLLKAKGPIWIPPVDPEMPAFLGYIAICWGFFEYAFEHLLQAIINSNKSTKRWRGLSFEDKAKLFKKEMATYFAYCPNVALYFHALVSDANSFQHDRNLLLHGYLHLRLYTKWIEGEPTAKSAIIATSRRKGRELAGEFDTDKLETLYYNLANLAGRINRLSYPISLDMFPNASLQEILFLQEFQRLHYPLLPPTNPTHGTPPRSSQG